jgi:hypothetical protein
MYHYIMAVVNATCDKGLLTTQGLNGFYILSYLLGFASIRQQETSRLTCKAITVTKRPKIKDEIDFSQLLSKLPVTLRRLLVS